MSQSADLMQELDDEDVEIENTPLYLYMQQYKSETQPKQNSTPFSRLSNYLLEKLRNLKCPLIQPIRHITGIHALRKYIGYSEPLYNLNAIYSVAHQTAIKECSILWEDDVNFLENICDESKEVIFNERLMYTGKLILPTIAIALWRIHSYFVKNVALKKVGLIISTCTAVYSLVSLMTWYKRKNDLVKSLTTTKLFINICEDYIRCSNKCLTYIRELEIFGKGLILPVPEFSLSRVENSSLFISSSITLPRMCAVIPFRVSLFNSWRKDLLLSRTSLFQLLKLYPLNRQIDNEQNYVAYLYLKNDVVNSLLSNEMPDTQQNIAEISFASLKCLFQLLHLHLSEFLRRFCLCFSSFASSPSKRVNDPFYFGNAILTPFAKELQTVLQHLNEGYKFNQYFSSVWKKEIKPRTSFKNDKNCPQEVMTSSLKSLSLHLLASLARIHEIMDNIIEDDDNRFQVIFNQLQLIQQDMQASNFCLEESFARLRKLRGENAEDLDLPFPLQIPTPINSNAGVPIIPFTENVDIASEDQVFEAYINSDDDNINDAGEYIDIDPLIEKQREISRKLFTELKTVLIPKAQEWKAREAKALGIVDIAETEKENNADEAISHKLRTCNQDISNTSGDSESEPSRSPTTHETPFRFSYCLPNDATNLSSDLIASVASLKANRARMFLQDDECFECDN